MRRLLMTAALAGALSLLAGEVRAQTVLTLSEALARARERAPDIVAARLAVDEARGRLMGASLRFQNNPEFDVAAGPRRRPGDSTLDLDAGITQRLEPGGRKSARVAGATADVDHALASLDERSRIALRDVAGAFFRAVHARERIRFLKAGEELAQTVLQTAERRHRAGEIAVLDVNVARAALARTRADRMGAESDYVVAAAELKDLLRLDADPDVSGTLVPATVGDPVALRQSALLRPEVRGLDAEIREADAEIQLGRTFGRPDYGVSMRYMREEGANVLLGGFAITLPTFSKGQELVAVGSARAVRLRSEREAAVRRIEIELHTALTVHERRMASLRELEQHALPGLDENDALATRSFDVGQIGLPDLLLIRRELLDTRFQHLDAQLDAALSRLDIDFKAGVLR
jgi:cobalt-zinc-cadmium efflux system outer membrane protein